MSAFFDAVGDFFGNLASIQWLALLLGLASFIVYLSIRARAYFHVLRAAYPDERFEFRRIWGAYMAAYGFNNVVPARGGDIVKLFLTKTSIPHSSYPAVGASFFVEAIFDLCMAVPILAFAFTQGAFPKPPDFSKLPAFDIAFFASNPRFTLFLLTVLAILALVGVRAPVGARARVLGARAPGPGDPARPPALHPRGVPRPARRVGVPLHGVLVPARGVQRRRLGHERAARARASTPSPRSCRSRPAAPASSRRCWSRSSRAPSAAPRSPPTRSASRSRSPSTSFAVGFAALVFIFRFRSFKEVIAAGREARGAEAE